MSRGLGRIVVPDPRDSAFPLRDKLPRPAPANTWKYWWANGWWGNQGQTDECTAYAWMAWVADGPVKHPKDRMPIEPLPVFYDEEQAVDGLPLPHQGSTVRAGAQILQRKGFVLSYHWAQSIEDVTKCLLTTGPLVVGTQWTDGMFTPDSNGQIRPTGAVAGGHCYVLDGVNAGAGLLRIKNSWGRSWGKGGFAYIAVDDFATLLAAQGEACLAVENPKA